jgi:hypothetical protein
MSIIKQHKTLGALAAAIFVASFTPQANAGPGPQQVFRPVTTMKQAESIPVGETISFSCGNCNGATTMTVDKDRSYLKRFTCPSCKRKFRVISPGGGGKGTDIYLLEDDDKHVAHLAATGKH